MRLPFSRLVSHAFPRSRRLLLAAVAVVLLAGLGVAAYFLWFRQGLPGPDSPAYRQYVEAFEVGLAALDTERRWKSAAKSSIERSRLSPKSRRAGPTAG